jgi:hypothetical protein
MVKIFPFNILAIVLHTLRISPLYFTAVIAIIFSYAAVFINFAVYIQSIGSGIEPRRVVNLTYVNLTATESFCLRKNLLISWVTFGNPNVPNPGSLVWPIGHARDSRGVRATRVSLVVEPRTREEKFTTAIKLTFFNLTAFSLSYEKDREK